MKTGVRCLGWFWLCAILLPTPMLAQNPAAPTLSIRPLPNQSVRLTWTNAATGFVLEAASLLGDATLWRPIPQTPILEGNQFAVTLDALAPSSFFRLQLPAVTGIRETSPANGETGVAVIRETIVRFTAPLANNAMVTTNNFFAGFGGRRLLSRMELSSDRRTATLFYLEPLPGSTRVNAVFDGTGLTDFSGRPIDADGDGQPGGQAVIAFDTLSLTPLAGTAVIGRVFASELVPGTDTGTNAVNKPLASVTITVDGMEQSLRTVTDAMGNFTLSPVPPGRFFVHIDGRTVTNLAAGIHYPDKAFYPFVGKAWDAVAGRTNNLAGGTGNIFLPLITVGTLQPVSMTQDTPISFPPSVTASNPALAGVSITVPANSLFSDDGTRGGKVGIAPVPPDRLPGPLPPGLELPIVITVQTDGPLNFDKPAPVCFPNLPDPVLGTPLPANSKQALISFNHKKGIWESVGSMTVNADGKFICTDPGVGIRQPGWHGVGPSPFGPPPPPSPERCEPENEASLQSLVALHGHVHKKGQRCGCKPDEKFLEVCFHNCSVLLEACNDEAAARLMEAQGKCRECGPYKSRHPCGSAAFKKQMDLCWERAYRAGVRKRRNCYNENVECIDICLDCWGTPVREHRNIALLATGNSVEENILAIGAAMEDLIRPFAGEDTPIPDEVLSQLEQLQIQANALAGGDAAGYLRKKVARVAEQFGHEPEEFDAGNAPEYPVLYTATIFRKADALILRGETGPFGQYSIFVPRNSVLADVSFYDPRTGRFASIAPNANPAAAYRLPRFTLLPLADDEPDLDKDGLPDLVEDVYGTDPTKADSDGDGIPDGAEIEQGTNPLDGFIVQTGVIATTKTPGPAVDVWAGNELIVTAEGTAGVSLFNAYNGMNPTIIAHVPTPGNAQRVAGAGNFIAVAEGDGGLSIIDISTPATARIIHQLPLVGAQAVAADAGTAYVGQGSGVISAVDLATGLVLTQVSVSSPVVDLAFGGDYLYALTLHELFAISLTDGALTLVGSTGAQRLFVGGDIAYMVYGRGYTMFDLTDPSNPKLIAGPVTAQFGWKQMVANGSGLGVAAVGLNSTDDGPHDIWLYDLSDPTKTDVFLTMFPTPGLARAVSIFNGLAYVADDAAGLEVINYLAYDAKGVPPTVALATSFPTSGAVAATPVRVTAKAGDDVQVRNVEFYLDGAKVFSDGNFPFEYRFVTAALTSTRTNFTLRARAFDTGGNFAWTDEMMVTLLPDTTPPRITKTAPLGGAKTLTNILAYFNEPINPATLNAASFLAFSAGADGLPGTADDLPVSGGVVSYNADIKAASLNFPSPLPDGIYRAAVTAIVADLAGNRLGADFTWQLRVADAVFWIRDTDGLWDDTFSWSTGAVPGPNDNVIIDVVPADVTVTIGFGTRAIKSLIANERLKIDGGTLQVAGSIELNKDLILNGGTIQGGTVIEKGGAKLIIDTNPNNTLDGVSVNGDLDVTGFAARLRIRNGLTVTGTIMLDNAGTIFFVGDQVLNTGTVIFGGNNGQLGVEGNNPTLTLGPTTVVRGKSGGIFGGGKLINQGLMSADVAGGTLNIFQNQFENAGTIETKNGSSLNIINANWSSAGRIEASGGGTLTLGGSWSNSGTINATDATVNLGGTFMLPNLGTFNRTGGTVNLTGVLDLNGGTLTLDAVTGSWALSGGTIKGGTVTESGGAKLTFTSDRGNTLDGVSVKGDLDLTSLSARLLIRNGLTLAGTVLLDNAGALGFAGDQTFNTGSVVFAGGSGFLSIEGNTTLTLGPAMVVRGKTGNIGQAVLFLGTGKLINQGLISADVAGGTLFIIPNQFENAGALVADGAGATIIIRANPFTNNGTIQELNGGKVLINP